MTITLTKVTDLPETVQDGIALLVERAPKGWQEKLVGAIADDALDIASTYRCVLAHVFGDYDDGLKFFGISHDTAPEFGFDYFEDRDRDNEKYPDYYELNEAWKAYIVTL